MPRHRYCLPDPKLVLTDELILEQIDAGSRVIDLGCGDGRLLARLRDEHACSVQGIDVDEELLIQAIARGVPVIKADLDRGLPEIPSGAFDFAVLGQTLQELRHPKELLSEIMRIARKALVVVPNFGHWRVRLQVLLQGRAPVTEALPYQWYDTPNLHVMSVYDFRDLARQLGLRIVEERPIINDRAVANAWFANLRAESVLYVLEQPNAVVRRPESMQLAAS